MRPTVSEQLAGLRRMLAEVVAPEVADAYAADVLDDALATLDLLAERWADVPSFLRWDIEATARVLELVGVAAPPPPDDVLDLGALDTSAEEVRSLLVQAMPAVLDDPLARDAAVRLFRERAERYPLAGRPRGGFAAHSAR
jgi:hypothetical protein